MIPLRELFKEELPEAIDDNPVHKRLLLRISPDIRPFRKLEYFDEDEFLNRLESPEATARLSRLVHLVNTKNSQVLRNEIDVVRMGYEHLTNPVSVAFPELAQVSEQSRGHSYTLWKLGDDVATVLVFKRCGKIEPIMWQGDMTRKPHEETLSQCIRMYSAEHQCPQMVLFDGRAMVVFRLRGSTKQDLLSADHIEGYAIDDEEREGDEGILSMRQALFLIIQEGYERIMKHRRDMSTWREQHDANYGNGMTRFQCKL